MNRAVLAPIAKRFANQRESDNEWTVDFAESNSLRLPGVAAGGNAAGRSADHGTPLPLRPSPEIARAHRLVIVALRAGLLIRSVFCDSCLRRCHTEAHHEDYAAPLSVEWLCRLCHIARDRQRGRRCVHLPIPELPSLDTCRSRRRSV